MPCGSLAVGRGVSSRPGPSEVGDPTDARAVPLGASSRGGMDDVTRLALEWAATLAVFAAASIAGTSECMRRRFGK